MLHFFRKIICSVNAKHVRNGLRLELTVYDCTNKPIIIEYLGIKDYGFSGWSNEKKDRVVESKNSIILDGVFRYIGTLKPIPINRKRVLQVTYSFIGEKKMYKKNVVF